MRFARGFAPVIGQFRRKRIAFVIPFNFGDFYRVRQRQRLGVNLCSAYDPHDSRRLTNL